MSWQRSYELADESTKQYKEVGCHATLVKMERSMRSTAEKLAGSN